MGAVADCLNCGPVQEPVGVVLAWSWGQVYYMGGCCAMGGVPHFEQLVLELDQKADLEQVEDVHQQAVQVGQSEDIVARQLARKNAAPQKDRTDRATAHQARVDDECSLDLVGVRVAVQLGHTNPIGLETRVGLGTGTQWAGIRYRRVVWVS